MPCQAPRSFYPGNLLFSTSIPSDPDTHEDFRPTSKLESTDLSLKDIVEQVLHALSKNYVVYSL